MKAKAISADARKAEWDRAFGSGSKKEFKGPKETEFYVHKRITMYLREKYPNTRFYSTLDGFNLGDQRMYVNAIQWFEPGVPDLFIFHRNKKHTMLVLEIKKRGAQTSGTEHLARQRNWLAYLETQGAKAQFTVGFDEAALIIDQYMK